MDLQPFDANDPCNRVADRLRKDVAAIVQRNMRSADYRKLTSAEQIEATAAGLMTGVIGVLFAHIEDGGRDALMEWLVGYLPQARAQAEGIFADALARASRH